ncbi:hypothetical protein [Paenibacillus fonticola]|uniref:hypothetical protein n=1 Tax=Paenibacillus fonticola TaxID=379896 RepID=UPI000379B68B|nr:hypothetical protein [Paenibacillus fonticola]
MNAKQPGQSIRWDKYIQGELDEQERRHIENLLFCDAGALESYMEAIEAFEHELPQLQQEEEEALLEALMDALPRSPRKAAQSARRKTRVSKNRWIGHPLFNYVIAASVTLFLLSFGVFDRLTTGARHVLPPSSEPSLSEQILDKTSGWLDYLKP